MRRAAIAWISLACAWGCSTTQAREEGAEAASVLGLPTSVPAEVTLLGERDGRFLDAGVDTRRSKLRFFFPVNATCRAVVEGSGEASYSNHGPYGRLHRGDQSCDPVGLLSLRAWRDRRPRQTTRGGSPIPRDAARYEIVYADEDLFLARGRFQLAGLVGWAGGYDTIAVFPNAPECEGILVRGEATMEYRDAGPEPLVLVDGRNRCPFLGFAMLKPG